MVNLFYGIIYIMEANISKCLMVLFFIYGAASLANLQYGFTYNPSESQLVVPTYPLGTLSKGTSINIKLTLPNPLSAALNSAMLQLYQLVGNSYQMVALNPMTSTSIYIEYYYDVTFTSSIIEQAVFQLRVLVEGSMTQLDYFYLEVTSYKTIPGLTAANNNTQTILKVVETFRYFTEKYIYLSSPSNLSIILTPSYSNQTYLIKLFSITSATASRSNGFAFGTPVPLSIDYRPLQQVVFYTANNVTSGYYALIVMPIPNQFTTGSKTITLTFQTDSYLCPFSSQFTDYYQIFQGCIRPVSDPGLPCVSYSSATGQCLQCINGYTLVSGSCQVNTYCPNRFYFHFGQCLPVSELCGLYESFTGACVTCSDTVNYTLQNGTCVKNPPIQCAPRQYAVNNTCADVSPTCQTFNASTGVCLSCIDMYQLINGTCVLMEANCGISQYAVGLTCYPIPPECLNFDKSAGRCLACVNSYVLQQGYCYKLSCPNRQVPSKLGAFCVDVSPLCDQYDTTTGNCISCKISTYTVRNGSCVQVVSPLAGCLERQNLGYGECANVTLNCQTFNLVTGDCDACFPGYYIDYRGICVANRVCGPNQWSINGECLKMPANCLSVNSLGFCVTCVDNSYRIIDGQCVYFKTCQPRQFVSLSGECVFVSPDCGNFNPTNGQCTTCANPDVQPVQGFCCPVGLIYSKGSCIDPSQQINGNGGNECLIRHPSLNFCLKCPEGFIPDYSVPFRCSPS